MMLCNNLNYFVSFCYTSIASTNCIELKISKKYILPLIFSGSFLVNKNKPILHENKPVAKLT